MEEFQLLIWSRVGTWWTDLPLTAPATPFQPHQPAQTLGTKLRPCRMMELHGDKKKLLVSVWDWHVFSVILLNLVAYSHLFIEELN